MGNGGTAGSLGSGAVVNNATLMLNRSDDTFFSNAISGSGSVIKAGSGDVVFDTAQSYSGGLTVRQGWAWARRSDSLGTGTITIGDATTGSGGRSDAGLLIDNTGNTTITNNVMTSGTGTLSLGGASTGDSAANVWTGTLTLNSNVNLRASNTTTRSSFAGKITGTGGITVTQGRVTVDNTSNDFTGGVAVNGGTILQLNAAEVVPNANALTVNGSLDFAYNAGGVETVGDLSGSGVVRSVLTGTHTLAVASKAGSTFAGTISDGSGRLNLAKSGTGTLVLSGNNTYTGGTVVESGTLLLGASDRLADSGAVTVNAGGFDLGGSSDTVGAVTLVGGVITNGTLSGASYDVRSGSVSAVLAGNGSLVKRTAGTVALTAANTYTGNTTIEAGTLLLSGSNRLPTTGAVTVNQGATLRVDGNQALASISGSGNIVLVSTFSPRYLTTGSVSGTFAGNISGAGFLNKVGPGTLTLTGSNTYSWTIVDGGTLATGGANVLPTNSTLWVNAGGTLLLGGNQDTSIVSGSGVFNLNGNTLRITGNGSVFSGSAIGGGTLRQDGPDTFEMVGTTSGSTGVVLNGGQLRLMSANRLSDTGAVTINNGVFDMNGFTDVAGSVTINGGRIINGTLQAAGVNMDNGRVTGVLTGTGGFTKTSAGTVTITSTSTYTGETRIQAGTLETTGANRLSAASTMTLSTGGTFKMGGDQSLASVSGSGAISLGNGTLTTGSLSSTFAGSITGNGGLTKAGPGTLTLSGSNAFTGDMSLTGGTLVLAGARALPTDAVVTMSSGATLQLSGTTVVGAIEQNGGTITGGSLVASLVSTQSGALNSAIENIVVNGTTYAAGILKRGAGTTTVGGANTFTGSIKVQGGTLQLSGSGSFDAASSLVLSSSATMDLNGKSQTFANLTGSGGTVALGGGQLTLANATDGLFAGVISGSGSLVKSGNGRLELTGVNTYTGATTVQAGELKLNGSVASSLVSLAAGATLSGTGSIAGDATIAGLHAPGNSPGIQTVSGSLTYSAGSGVTWELAGNTAALADRGIDFDGINVGGSLTFSGSTALNLAFNNSGSLVNWNDPFWSTDKLGANGWLLYDVANSTTGLSNLSVNQIDWLDASNQSLLGIRPYASFGLEQVGGDVYLTFQAVPEPSSLVLLGIGGALAGLAARRRRQGSVDNASPSWIGTSAR